VTISLVGTNDEDRRGFPRAAPRLASAGELPAEFTGLIRRGVDIDAGHLVDEGGPDFWPVNRHGGEAGAGTMSLPNMSGFVTDRPSRISPIPTPSLSRDDSGLAADRVNLLWEKRFNRFDVYE